MMHLIKIAFINLSNVKLQQIYVLTFQRSIILTGIYLDLYFNFAFWLTVLKLHSSF